ncbi:basic leucine zipper transcriptional factor ATF-like [Gadus morhua]|uniref:basic leucine zipper transcriptional factor ATF-like n=1 Tax=Gadus morhua TaxID=8049 RepID=UPI0011B68FEC|nr:basic leucine zipper transcriptional factor ATF-like [Gadus morhua]
MAHGSDSNDTSYNRSPSPASQPGSSDDAKRVMRREKNRIAAQKSRMRQTQKADTLHLESEELEKVNAALRKEVKQLTEEKKHLSSILSSHEPQCTGGHTGGHAAHSPEPIFPATAAGQHGGATSYPHHPHPHPHHPQPHSVPHHLLHQHQQHVAAGPHYQH